MLPPIQLDASRNEPLYRQLSFKIHDLIDSGVLRSGDRLPATRELAGQIGLNRTTVSAAYELLESEGLIRAHVGRGSFVCETNPLSAAPSWETRARAESDVPDRPVPDAEISFASARPSELLFPLDEFRAACHDVIDSDQAQSILQLGSPSGYAPLRRYLFDAARAEGAAHEDDEILITSGCQQAFDLIQRVLVANGETVLLEDPVYPGLRNTFARAEARVIGIPVGEAGVEPDSLGRVLERERPRLLVLTPNFQNPTGATLPEQARNTIISLARKAGTLVIENDIYGDLRYEGSPLPTIKQLDTGGGTVLLRSFSKLAFPGLRVGWIVGPRALIRRLTEAKQLSDLHTDQLSQAVLLRFAESGALQAHRKRVLAAGSARLKAALSACERYLPPESRFTRPRGGMSLWVQLPSPLDAGELLPRAQRRGVSYLPGRYFAVSRPEPGGLRLSFAQLAPEKIRAGLEILGTVFGDEVERAREWRPTELTPAMV